MSDDADHAQAINDAAQARALESWRRQQDTGTGTVDCVDCDEPIAPGRKKAKPSCTRCIDCQTDFEKRRR